MPSMTFKNSLAQRRWWAFQVGIMAALAVWASALVAQGIDPMPRNDLWIGSNSSGISGTSGGVKFMASSDTRLVIGGPFDHLNPFTGRFAMLDRATGAAREDLPTVHGADQPIRDFEPDGQGGWFVAGKFPGIEGQAITNLAHILPGGALDRFWAPNPDGVVNCLWRDGGTLYIGGSFSQCDGGFTRSNLAAVDAVTGTVLPWDPDVGGTVNCMTMANGALYFGGQFQTVSGQTRRNTAAVDAAGAVLAWDPRAGLGANEYVEAMAALGDIVYFGGYFGSVGGQSRSLVAAVKTDGTLSSWAPGIDRSVGTEYVRDISIANGNVYFCGKFRTVNGQIRQSAAAVDTSGTLQGWNPATIGVLSIYANGASVYLGGEFRNIRGKERCYLGEVDAVSGVPTNWQPHANSLVLAIEAAGNDVMVGGAMTGAGLISRKALALLDIDPASPDFGRPVASFTPVISGRVGALCIVGDVVYVCGDFTHVNGQARGGTAAIKLDGTLLPWDPGITRDGSTPQIFKVLHDQGKIFIGGMFTHVGGMPRKHIAVVDAATAALDPLDLEFTPIVDASGTWEGIWDIAVRNDTVYLAGWFSGINGQPRLHVCSTTLQGDLTAWDPGVNKMVRAIVATGAAVYLGGGFDTLEHGAVQRRAFAAVHPDGAGEALPLDCGFLATSSILSLKMLGENILMGANASPGVVLANGTKAKLLSLGTSGAIQTLDVEERAYGLGAPRWNFSAMEVQGSNLYVACDRDAGPWSVSASLTRFTIVPKIAAPELLPAAELTRNYSFQLAGEGLGALDWSVVSGALPPGLSLSGGGLISGTPAPSALNAVYRFTISALDTAGTNPPPEDRATRTFMMAVRDTGGPGAVPLPYTSSCEPGTVMPNRWAMGGDACVRIGADASVAAGGNGLILSAADAAALWPLQGGLLSPGEALADDPSRWDAEAASHTGSIEWSVATGGAAEIEVSFDWGARRALQDWYTNLVIEYDAGLGWTCAGGADATVVTTPSGTFLIYRPHGADRAIAPVTLTIGGLSGLQEMALRLRWLCKYPSTGYFATAHYIDNIRVVDPAAVAPLVLTSAVLPQAAEGSPYDVVLAASGGLPPYAWELVQGSVLPAWLTLDRVSGRLSGTPPVGAAGAASFGIQVSDGSVPALVASADFSIDVLQPVVVPAPLTILTPFLLADAREGEPYGPLQLTASGGSGAYTWSLARGSVLPPGLMLDMGTGGIGGTPAAGTGGDLGTSYSFTLSVSDTGVPAQSALALFTLRVLPAEKPAQAPRADTIAAAASGGCAMGSASGGLALLALLSMMLACAVLGNHATRRKERSMRHMYQ